MSEIITVRARFSNRINAIYNKAKVIFSSPIFLSLFVCWNLIEFGVVLYNLFKIFIL